MKKQLLLLSLFIFFSAWLQAQKDGSIKGLVKDTAANLPIGDATVTILRSADSSLVSFTRTNDQGFFSLRNIGPGQYRLLITHVGYRNTERSFIISGALPFIDFGRLPLAGTATLLTEVTVTQERPPVTIRNDTIEFNAGSFKTKPNAVVEDLLKKFPGIQVDKDGKIKANGEEVKRVLVDGKEFFGNDPKMATKNLPADAVDKVQVFDRKSEQSRFTGFDDGNSEKTINLTIKPEKKNGVFGKATAGAGDKGLYEGNFNVNSFSGDRQLSAIGLVNNTNKQGFSFMDILNFSGGLPGSGRSGSFDIGNSSLPIQGAGSNEGITTTRAGGLNYNNNWQKKVDFMSNYFYNHKQTGIAENIQQQWLLPGNHFTTLRNNNSGNSNENHRVNITADYKLDTANAVKIVSALNLQQSQYNVSSRYHSAAADGNLLNSGEANSFIGGSGYSWASSALFRHRFPKKGRTFSATLSLNINNNNSNGGLRSQNNYYDSVGRLQQADTIDQLNRQSSRNNTYGVVASYTEPLSKKSLLEFNYNFSRIHGLSDKATFDADKQSGKYSLLNELLTNRFLNNYTTNKPGINWRFQQKKYSFVFGAAVQVAELQSNFHLLAKDSAIGRSFFNLLPNANLQFNVSQYQNIRVFYNSYSSQPSVTQLQPIADNSDPLNIKIGNPALKQAYNQQLQAHYISFDPYRHTSFFASLNASLTGNSIVNADQVDSQGQRTTRPVNVNGVYNASINTAWGFPVRKLKSKLNLNSALAESHTVGFVNTQRNNINTLTASQEITWNYSLLEWLDLGAGTEITYNKVSYSLQGQPGINYWAQHYTFDMNLYLPHGFSIASDIDYTTRNGLAQGYNINEALWNAGIARQVFKSKQGEFRLQVYDILNQHTGISRSSNQNYIEDKSYNVLKRYFQFSFTYNISRFAGKNMAAPSRRDNNIQLIRAKG